MACVNKNTKEFKALLEKHNGNALLAEIEFDELYSGTEVEIMGTDVLDYKASVSDIKYKRATILSEFNPGEEASIPNTDAINNTYSNEVVRTMSNRLSNQFGISYEVISPEQASQITSNRYNGEVAFYHNVKVYFVGNNLSLNTALQSIWTKG